MTGISRAASISTGWNGRLYGDEFGESENTTFSITRSTQSWVHIDDSFTWVYAAYWDHRIRDDDLSVEKVGKGPYLRILMIGPYNEEFPSQLLRAQCHYYYEGKIGKSVSNVVGLSVQSVDNYDPDLLSRSYYVLCAKPDSMTVDTPTDLVPMGFVFHLDDQETKKWNKDANGFLRNYIIPIRGSHRRMHYPFKQTRKLMSCMKPFFNGPYIEIYQLVNSLIVQQALGMQHIVLYNAGAMTPIMYKIINMARETGLSVEVCFYCRISPDFINFNNKNNFNILIL